MASGRNIDEVAAERDKRDAGDLLRVLAQAIADDRAECKPELARHERKYGDGNDDRDDRQPDQSQAEPDSEFVHADAEPERDDGKATNAGDAACSVFILITAHQRPDPDGDHRGRGQVIRGRSDDARQAVASREPDERHAGLEYHEYRRDAHAHAPAGRRGGPDRGSDREGVEAEREHEGQQLQHGSRIYPPSPERRAGASAAAESVVAPVPLPTSAVTCSTVRSAIVTKPGLVSR